MRAVPTLILAAFSVAGCEGVYGGVDAAPTLAVAAPAAESCHDIGEAGWSSAPRTIAASSATPPLSVVSTGPAVACGAHGATATCEAAGEAFLKATSSGRESYWHVPAGFTATLSAGAAAPACSMRPSRASS